MARSVHFRFKRASLMAASEDRPTGSGSGHVAGLVSCPPCRCPWRSGKAHRYPWQEHSKVYDHHAALPLPSPHGVAGWIKRAIKIVCPSQSLDWIEQVDRSHGFHRLAVPHLVKGASRLDFVDLKAALPGRVTDGASQPVHVHDLVRRCSISFRHLAVAPRRSKVPAAGLRDGHRRSRAALAATIALAGIGQRTRPHRAGCEARAPRSSRSLRSVR
jgi:hypothetical protein